MTSRTGSLVASPAWGEAKAEENAVDARAAARWPARARPGGLRALRPPLELRVRPARPAAVGLALALGFAMLWAFLLIGVAEPASRLGDGPRAVVAGLSGR